MSRSFRVCEEARPNLICRSIQQCCVSGILCANAKTGVRILNFVRLIGTYGKRAAQVVSANLGGPGDR